ncbi:hypothetical protein [Bradyrhizobium elkanii]
MRLYDCRLLGFVDALGGPIKEMPISCAIRARVIMNEDHEELGGGKDDITITSAVRSIDFERRLIVTQNNLYQF